MDTDSGSNQVLDRDERAPSTARRRVVAACDGLPSELVDTAVLLTSELVTNAVQHGAGRIVLTVVRDEGAVRVEVCDDGPGAPTPQCCEPDDEHGRGLLLLEALATAWGTSSEEGSGTRVWFSLDAR